MEVNLIVIDNWFNNDTQEVIVNVLDETYPIACAGEDRTISTGNVVIFNGSESTDNGKITRWVWSFEYNGYPVELEGESVQFIFNVSGRYSIYLTVFDEFDNVGEDTVIINVVPEEDDGEGEEGNSPILIALIIGIVIILVIIGLVIFFLARTKKEDETIGSEEDISSVTTEQDEDYYQEDIEQIHSNPYAVYPHGMSYPQEQMEE